MLKSEPQAYTFDALTLRFASLGVPFLSDSTKERIAALPVETARAINRAAWKAKRESTRIANRHCNVSVPGNHSIYDRASHRADVAELVCKATWKRICAG